MTMPTTCRNWVSRTYNLLVSGIDLPWLVQILISIGAVYVKIGTLIVYFQMILYLYQSIYFLLFCSTQVNSSLLQVTTLSKILRFHKIVPGNRFLYVLSRPVLSRPA